MGRAEQAAAALPRVARIAQQSGPALRKAFQLLSDGALVGPAGSRLFSGMVDRHRSTRSGFLEAFDQVHRLARQAKDQPPRVAAPYIAGPPQGGPPASAGVHSGKPDHLNLLGIELRRAGRSWQDAGAELSRILGGLGLSTAPAQSIKSAGLWVAGQQGDLNRRRDELLKTDRSRAVFDLDLMAAMGNGPRGKGLLDKAWEQWARHYLPGLGHGTKELLLQSLAYNPATAAGYAIVDTDGFLERSIAAQAPALLTGVQHPAEFAKAAVNWDLWKKDPVRAFGETVPSLVITAVTMGGGSGSGASTRLSMALRKLGRHKGETPDPPPTRGARSLEEAAEQAGRTGGFGRQDTRTFPPPVTRPAPPARPMAPAPRAGGGGVAPDGRPHTGGDGEATPPTRRFGPQELAHLRRLEDEARRIADPFGVRVDYTRRPIDSANAAGFNKAMERVAREYPSVFRDMENIEIQNMDDMRATAPGISLASYFISG
ncbi:hypothetical protein [Actinomadura sp. HBU206391]|uniref:hypothetical protein n=1 Tax=Actinomadura sp. HBU206391 TaxID=2731692 RepID=UPI00164EE13E|nr:hypothetical protein [Actinomadura sp. HBU206391]